MSHSLKEKKKSLVYDRVKSVYPSGLQEAISPKLRDLKFRPPATS